MLSHVSVDAALLDIRQSRNSNVLPAFILARVLLLGLGLLRRQGEDLELVGRKTLAVHVLRGHDDYVISERVQVVGGKGSLVAANLFRRKENDFVTVSIKDLDSTLK